MKPKRKIVEMPQQASPAAMLLCSAIITRFALQETRAKMNEALADLACIENMVNRDIERYRVKK